MRLEYAEHIARYVDYIKEYWEKAPMDPQNPMTVPGTEKIDFTVMNGTKRNSCC